MNTVAKTVTVFLLIAIYSCFVPVRGFAEFKDVAGKEVILASPEARGVVYLAVDKPHFNRTMSNIIGKDQPGYLCVLLPNKVVEIDGNTRAVALEVNFAEQTVKVRITEGMFAGTTGWVLMTHIVEL